MKGIYWVLLLLPHLVFVQLGFCLGLPYSRLGWAGSQTRTFEDNSNWNLARQMLFLSPSWRCQRASKSWRNVLWRICYSPQHGICKESTVTEYFLVTTLRSMWEAVLLVSCDIVLVLVSVTPDRETPIYWPRFQDNLGKLTPEELNQSGFWWRKRWWFGSDISWP